MMTLDPLYDKVIVLPDEQAETTKAGLLIPISARIQRTAGTVVAVGPGMVSNGQIIPLSVKIGDKVMYNKFIGTEIILDEKEHLIMREIEILAIIRG